MYICYRITSYIHDNQDKCVEQALRILNSMPVENNYFAELTIRKLNSVVLLASDTTKTALGLTSNIFTIDGLTTDKDLVKVAIETKNNTATGIYDKLLNTANLVVKDELKTINGISLLGKGDITLVGGGNVDLSNYYDKASVDTKLADYTKTTELDTYKQEVATSLNSKLDNTTEFKTINGNTIKGTGNIEITSNVDLTNYYDKYTLDDKLNEKVNNTGLKTINGNSILGTGDIAIGKKTISKYIVIGVNGQSNSVGYDESPLTPYDVAIDPDRILQYSDNLKPLTYCAECFQNMNTIGKRSDSSANMANDRKNEFGHTADRDTYVKTKGIHLPLANLILSAIPDDYGVIIVPGSYGGKRISEFMPGKTYYTNFIARLKGALNLPGSVFGGIVWCQGEHDAQAKMTGANYLTSLKTMISGVNTELASYANKAVKGTITENDWYFFDWPKYFKDLDTGGILVELRKYFGDRYVEIPTDTPVNKTDYTTSTPPAHFGDNSYRTIIAPRLFKAMASNNAFLVNEYTPTTASVGVSSTELAEGLALKVNTTDLNTYKQEVTAKLDSKLDSSTKFKTINGHEIKGDGNITIDVTGGTADLSGYYSKQEVDTKLDTKAPLDGFTALQQEVQTKYVTAITDVQTKLFFINENNTSLAESLKNNKNISVDTSIPIPQDTAKYNNNFTISLRGIEYSGPLGGLSSCIYSPESYNTMYCTTNLKTKVEHVTSSYGILLARNKANNKGIWLWTNNGTLLTIANTEEMSAFTALNTAALWNDPTILTGVGKIKLKRVGTVIELYKLFEYRFVKVAEVDIGPYLTNIDLTSDTDANYQPVWGLVCGWTIGFVKIDPNKGYWYDIRLDNDGTANLYYADPWRPLQEKDIEVLSNATLDTTGSIRFVGGQVGKVTLKKDVFAMRYSSSMAANAGLYISPTYSDDLSTPRGIATETSTNTTAWHTFNGVTGNMNRTDAQVQKFFTPKGTFEVEFSKGYGTVDRDIVLFTRVRDNATFWVSTPKGNGWHQRLGLFTKNGSGIITNIMVKDY